MRTPGDTKRSLALELERLFDRANEHKPFDDESPALDANGDEVDDGARNDFVYAETAVSLQVRAGLSRIASDLGTIANLLAADPTLKLDGRFLDHVRNLKAAVAKLN